MPKGRSIKLRHLEATIGRFTRDGNCFQRSVAMVMDVPTAKLVIGTLVSDHDYLHAWVQDAGMYLDPSRYEKDRGLKRFQPVAYIAANRARDIRVIPRLWVLGFAQRGALSPWMLRPDETYHRLGSIMGHKLLDELAIPYRVNADGYLYPGE